MQAHLEFLERNADRIDAAGPLRDPRSGLPAGGFWAMNSAGVSNVWDLVRMDPFRPTGLRKSVTVRHWNRVFSSSETAAASMT